MRVLLVDDEVSILEEEREMLLKIDPQMEIVCQNSSRKALEQITKEGYDIAILDIEMPQINGLMLAKEIKMRSPLTNIIFVTAYSQYAINAFELYVSGYLLKPLKQEKLEEALENLRIKKINPDAISINVQVQNQKGVYIRCFGDFEVFYDGLPIEFERNKAKEILAYLIDKEGAVADTEEICLALWEDSQKAYDNHHYFRNLMSQLKKTLKNYNAQDILEIRRNQFSVNPNKLVCDYYLFKKGNLNAINAYQGEYMMQYSWAEMTMAKLNNEKEV